MNTDRLDKVLAVYGADEARWPEADKVALGELLAANPALRVRLETHRQLDAALDAYLVDIPPFDATAFAATLPQKGDDLISLLLAWLVPTVDGDGVLENIRAGLWRPAFAAACTLVLGITIGSTMTIESDDDGDSWDDEIYILALELPEETDVSSL